MTVMTDPFTTRPSWAEVMSPLSDSAVWPFIRNAASTLLENQLHSYGDFESGISSSDINHTIFGVASWVERDGDYVANVLRRLVEEVEFTS